MDNKIQDLIDKIINFGDKVTNLGELLLHRLIIRPILKYRAWRCRRAKAYLLRYDTEYRSHWVDGEIVLRRNELYGQGVSPLDPSIPDRWSLEEELPALRWPQKDIL